MATNELTEQEKTYVTARASSIAYAAVSMFIRDPREKQWTDAAATLANQIEELVLDTLRMKK